MSDIVPTALLMGAGSLGNRSLTIANTVESEMWASSRKPSKIKYMHFHQ